MKKGQQYVMLLLFLQSLSYQTPLPVFAALPGTASITSEQHYRAEEPRKPLIYSGDTPARTQADAKITRTHLLCQRSRGINTGTCHHTLSTPPHLHVQTQGLCMREGASTLVLECCCYSVRVNDLSETTHY